LLTAERLSATHTPAHTAEFRAVDTRRPAALAAAVSLIAAALAVALIIRGIADGVTFAAFASYVIALVLLGAGAVAAYWALAIANLRYEVADGTLAIVWGFTRQVVPVASMERVVRGRALGQPRLRGLEIPGWGCHIGRARVRRLGRVLLYSTHRRPDDLLYVVTAGATYGLSPADQARLVRALQREAAKEPPIVRQEAVRHPLAALAVWRDRFALTAAGVAAVLALAAIGVVFSRYAAIPAQTVIPFPAGDHTASKHALLAIPLAAFTVLVLDIGGMLALHRLVRPIAYLLVVGGVFVEALMLIAAILSV
jgi:hypothetical protein